VYFVIGLKGEIPYGRMTSEGLLTSDLNGLFDRG